MGNLIWILLEIYCSLQQWKNFANRSRTDKVIAMVRVAPFFWLTVYKLLCCCFCRFRVCILLWNCCVDQSALMLANNHSCLVLPFVYALSLLLPVHCVCTIYSCLNFKDGSKSQTFVAAEMWLMLSSCASSAWSSVSDIENQYIENTESPF